MKVLCVDFDNTICSTGPNFPHVGKPTIINKVIWWYVRRKKKKGWIIVLNTLREPYKGLDIAVDFCKENNIPIDYVNENIPQAIQQWGDSRKIACDIYLDDRNFGFVGWLLRRFG